MERFDDMAMAVRVGMNAKEFTPHTWPTTKQQPTPSSSSVGGKAVPEWKGKAIVTHGPRGISVR